MRVAAYIVAACVSPLLLWWHTPGQTTQLEKHSAPTLYRDVLPILQDHCQSCHRPGEVAPMPLVTYEQTRAWASGIAKAVQAKRMPPWFADPRVGKFSNDPSLSEAQVA